MPWEIGVFLAIWILGVEYRLRVTMRLLNLVARKMGHRGIS